MNYDKVLEQIEKDNRPSAILIDSMIKEVRRLQEDFINGKITAREYRSQKKEYDRHIRKALKTAKEARGVEYR